MQNTAEVVATAAEDLEKQGITPSYRAIRDALGFGSYSDIGPALKAWRAEKSALAGIRFPVPDAVQSTASRLCDQIWSLALSQADDLLRVEREAFQAAQSEILLAEQDYCAAEERLLKELSELRQRNAKLAEETSALNESVRSLRIELAGMTARYEECVSHLTQERASKRAVEEELATVSKEAAINAGRVDALQAQLSSVIAKVKTTRK